jgi:alcohol dehydrogenase
MSVEGEPSPSMVDVAVGRFRRDSPEVVVGIGGGSVLDAAKAIAGLLPHGNSVMDHLEGVGKGIPYRGPSVPFVAAPTTAGTGSEATKNAVLSVRGNDGFKKSFRHDCLMPEYAVVDPAVLESCPPKLIAADGMDAVTQLIESYVSSRANPLTDALAWTGLESARDGLWSWYEGRDDASGGRSKMAFAALVSGITLAQTGLGAVHGIASPLGALHPLPHGVVCGTLLASATRANIRALEEREPERPALTKYARLGTLLSGSEAQDHRSARAGLVDLLAAWTDRLGLPRLSEYGIEPRDLPQVVAESRGSSMKTNPIVLTDEEIRGILQERL